MQNDINKTEGGRTNSGIPIPDLNKQSIPMVDLNNKKPKLKTELDL